MLSVPFLAALVLAPVAAPWAKPEDPPVAQPRTEPVEEQEDAFELLLAEAAELERQGDELREQGQIAAQTGRDTSELVEAEVERYRRAIELYDQAVALRPAESRPYRLRAWARAKHDRDGAQDIVQGPSGVLGATARFAPQSLADADRAVELAPVDPEAYLVRARIHSLHFQNTWELYSGLSEEDRAQAGHLKPDVASARRALADYKKTGQLDPERCEAWAAAGEMYFLCFKFELASEMYTRAHECGAMQDETFLAQLAMVAASPSDFFPSEMLDQYDLSDGGTEGGGSSDARHSSKAVEASSAPTKQG